MVAHAVQISKEAIALLPIKSVQHPQKEKRRNDFFKGVRVFRHDVITP